MFIPIGDDNPTERTPYVNYGLIAINVLAFFLFCLGPADDPNLIRWMMIPADLHWPTLFTSLFLHGGWMHLIGNMLFLWIFGDNIEDKLGHLGYLVFYFVCGLAADAKTTLSQERFPGPTLLVLGNEARGVAPAARALCDRMLSVPMRGGTESLNVAASAAVALYAWSLRPAPAA